VSRRDVVRAALLGAGGLVLAACGGDRPGTQTQVPQRLNADLAKVQWPAFVTAAGGDVRRLYEFQLTHGELMRYIPCFCGCGASGHTSNHSCFVRSVAADGGAVLDDMAPT
jgi:hypothetical protein